MSGIARGYEALGNKLGAHIKGYYGCFKEPISSYMFCPILSPKDAKEIVELYEQGAFDYAKKPRSEWKHDDWETFVTPRNKKYVWQMVEAIVTFMKDEKYKRYIMEAEENSISEFMRQI